MEFLVPERERLLPFQRRKCWVSLMDSTGFLYLLCFLLVQSRSENIAVSLLLTQKNADRVKIKSETPVTAVSVMRLRSLLFSLEGHVQGRALRPNITCPGESKWL